MKLIVPRITARTKRGTWVVTYPHMVAGTVKRKSREFSDHRRALDFLAELNELYPKVGAVGLSMDAVARDEYWSAKRLLPDGVSLVDVARFFVRGNPRGADMELEPLAEQWLDMKSSRDNSVKSSDGRRQKLLAFLQSGDVLVVADLTPERIEKHLWRMVGIGGNRRRLARKSAMSEASAIRDFCTWLVKRKKLLPSNPMELVDIGDPDMPDPVAFRAVDAARLMATAEVSHQRVQAFRRGGGLPAEIRHLGDVGRLVPYYALALFAGLRPSEILRLTAESFSLDGADPFIRVKKLKRGRGVRLVPVAPNLLAWLRTYAPSFPVQYHRTECRRIRDTAGLLDTWQSDVLRHTYISARLAVGVSEVDVARAAGNRPDVVHTYYRDLMTKAEGLDLFDIWPTAHQ